MYSYDDQLRAVQLYIKLGIGSVDEGSALKAAGAIVVEDILQSQVDAK